MFKAAKSNDAKTIAEKCTQRSVTLQAKLMVYTYCLA